MKLKRFLTALFFSGLMLNSVAQSDSAKVQPAAEPTSPEAQTTGSINTAGPDTLSQVTENKVLPDSVTSDAYEPAPVQSESKTTAPVSAAKTARYLKKANELYAQKAYAEAIPYYEKARLGESDTKLILSNLGDCYRLTNNTAGKLNTYGELIRLGRAERQSWL